MKAITIWQPWAALIIAGAKPYEFRGWHFPERMIGQRIGIHAGVHPVSRREIAELLLRLRGPEAWTTMLRPAVAIPLLERAHLQPSSLMLGVMLGTAVLGKPVLGNTLAREFGGPINDSTRDEHSNWAWPMLDIRPLAEPSPIKGAQGFWNWSEAT